MSSSALRPSLVKFITKKHPHFDQKSSISREALNDLLTDYVEDVLEDEIGEITELERSVIESLRKNELISEKPADDAMLASRTFGERLADGIAEFGGSWRFILLFFGFIMLWIAANVLLWKAGDSPDPYPFILLNLMLSCLASLQAPIIMMSQNRQEARDREHSRQDYQINLKAELEIRHLHEKMDHLLQNHSRRLLEIQEIQVQLLQQLLAERAAGHTESR
jgi:uncharacterized membrane protein